MVVTVSVFLKIAVPRFQKYIQLSEAHVELCQTSKMKHFVKMVTVFYPLFSKKCYILDVSEGSEYATDYKQTYCLQQR